MSSPRTKILKTLSDAGASSIASFAAGLMALRSFSVYEVALYSLLFSAALTAMIIPQYMSFVPQRLNANRQESIVRTAYGRDAIAGLALGLPAALLVVASGLPLLGEVGSEAFAILAITAAMWTVVSPFQDHVRSALHITGHHGAAASVSLVHLSVVGIALVYAIAAPERTLWHAALPFGALFLGNSLSAAVGVLLHRRVAVVPMRANVTVGIAVKTALSAFITQGVGYSTNLLVALLVAPAALASLETARIAAQPVLVLGVGLGAFFLPRVIRLRALQQPNAGMNLLRMTVLIGVGGGLYCAALPLAAPALSALTSQPVPVWLSIARAASFSLEAAAVPFNRVLLADRRYGRAIANSSIAGAAWLTLTLALIPFLGVFAVPMAHSASAIIRGALGIYDFKSYPPRDDSVKIAG